MRNRMFCRNATRLLKFAHLAHSVWVAGLDDPWNRCSMRWIMHKSTSIYAKPCLLATHQEYQIHDGKIEGKQQLSRRIAINATRHQKRCVYTSTRQMASGGEKDTKFETHGWKWYVRLKVAHLIAHHQPPPNRPRSLWLVRHSCAQNVSIVCIVCRLAACPWPWGEAGQAATSLLSRMLRCSFVHIRWQWRGAIFTTNSYMHSHPKVSWDERTMKCSTIISSFAYKL